MKQLHILPVIALFLGGIFFITNTNTLHAISDFDPDIILQDSQLENTRGMTKNDIQAFLVTQHSPLAKLRTPNTSGTEARASDIIYDAAKKYNINPKYLLVTLEKEQSLVTKKELEQRRLDWATGYAVCDSCKKDDPKIQKHKGFAQQIDGAAGIMRWYYNNLKKESWIKRAHQTYKIDNTEVTPKTHATAFLYNYTPHIQGNRNFWKIWQKWFSQVYPDGTLIRRKNSATVYIIKNGKKHPFTSTSARISRHGQAPVITVPYHEFIRYTKGSPITLPNYAIIHDGQRYFLLDDDILRPFDTTNTMRKMGYHPDEIISVETKDIAHLQEGKPITQETKNITGRVVRLDKKPLYYYIKDGYHHQILDKDIIAVNFPHLSIERVKKEEIKETKPGGPVLIKNGTLVKSKRQPQVYIIEYGKKRHIPNKAVFNILGYKEEHVITLNTRAIQNHKTGDPLLIRKKDSRKKTPKSQITRKKTPKPKIDIVSGKMFTISQQDSNTGGPTFRTPIDTYLVMDAKTGTVFMEKNSKTSRPLASLTKVLTANYLFDQNINLNQNVTYTPSIHKGLYHYFRIHPGEVVKNTDLLDASMVSSLNTATKMLVTSVGKEADVIAAIQQGLDKTGEYTQTSIDSVTGESPKSISSAREYAKLFLLSLNKHPKLKDSLGKKTYRYNEIADRDNRPGHYDTHTNALVHKKNKPYTVIASKTGYLYESGTNLAMLIERNHDKKQFVIITMGNPNARNPYIAPDKLTRYALSQF